MARRTIPVDKEKLRQSIVAVEKDGPLKNRNELAEAVAKHYNSTGDNEEISHSVVTLRIKAFGLEESLKTPKGKRGRAKMSDEQKAAMAAGRAGGRTSKADKIAGRQDYQAALAKLEESVPPRFTHVLEQVKSGSRTAAVKLNCLGCMGFGSTKDVRECSVFTCSLWMFRPFQGKLEPEEENEPEEEAA